MWGLLRLAPIISYPHAVLFDIVVVVVVLTFGCVPTLQFLSALVKLRLP